MQRHAVEDEIDWLTKKIDEMQHRLDDDRREIDSRVYIGEHRQDARKAVADKFDRARSAANRESGYRN